MGAGTPRSRSVPAGSHHRGGPWVAQRGGVLLRCHRTVMDTRPSRQLVQRDDVQASARDRQLAEISRVAGQHACSHRLPRGRHDRIHHRDRSRAVAERSAAARRARCSSHGSRTQPFRRRFTAASRSGSPVRRPPRPPPSERPRGSRLVAPPPRPPARAALVLPTPTARPSRAPPWSQLERAGRACDLFFGRSSGRILDVGGVQCPREPLVGHPQRQPVLHGRRR